MTENCELALPVVKCMHCGQDKVADSTNRHLCVDCVKAENSRYSYLRAHQSDWMAAAADAGIDVWLQQPGETQWEYTVWVAYRDSYPGRKPSYQVVAQQLGTTYNVVKKVAQRWTFAARMQAWITECDRITLLQRNQEILDMNKDHISMAQRLRDKLSMAIDSIDPMALKPGDIASLARLSTELERKARVDEIDQDAVRRDMLRDQENPELKKSPTKSNDLSEVLSILVQSGVFGENPTVGVRKTEEIVVKGGET